MTFATQPAPAAVGVPASATHRDRICKQFRVLHLINGEHYSGAERVQDLLARRLPELGYDIGLACVKPDKFPEMRQCREAPLYRTPMRWRFDLAAVVRLCRIIRDDGYQILHAHTPRTLAVGRLAAILTARPLVYHVHSPAARDSTRSLQNRINVLSESLCLARRTRLIAVSHSLGQHMRLQGYGAERIFVAPNGVPRVDPPPRNPPRGEWTLGTVALFRPRKGTEVLLEALAKLRRSGHSVRLRAVGPFETREYEDLLKSSASRLGIEDAVEWAGFTRDVNAELRRFDLFVLPSLFGEGLPMVVLEAMAAGVPVVGTRVEGVPEAVRDGLDGALAAPNDAEDLAGAICRIMTGDLDWRSLRGSALRRHAEHFSDESMARHVAAVYRDVLSETGLFRI
ncbi:MAG: glycosyltransferase [Planctomycetes bacterium]|nr:glycosyltransferase [Planctomycetota bacterium]